MDNTNNTIDFKLRSAVLLSVICLIGVLSSCKKKGELHPDFESSSINVLQVDTSSVHSQTLLVDSAWTNLATRRMLGIYHDPVFGVGSAAFYNQFGLSGSKEVDSLSSTLTLDSVVLSLGIEEVYGKDKQLVGFTVYELQNALIDGEKYFSNQMQSLVSGHIAKKVVEVNGVDSVQVGAGKEAPQIRIPLDMAFGQKLLDQFGTATVQNEADFLDFFKGLYICPSNSELEDGSSVVVPALETGSVASVNFSSAVKLYYKITATGEAKEVSFVSTGGLGYSRFAHDYSGKPVEVALQQSLDGVQQKTYVQSMSGLKTKLVFPNIINLANGRNVAIQKAELIIPATYPNEKDNHESYVMRVADIAGVESDIIDLSRSRDEFGGEFDASQNAYVFNIKYYVQQVMDGEMPNSGMDIIAVNSSISGSRTSLDVRDVAGQQMKLVITYSVL